MQICATKKIKQKTLQTTSSLKWKTSTIAGALHQAKKITSERQSEVQNITQSFVNSGYPPKCVHDSIKEFENREADELIIPVHWFDKRTNVGIRLPFYSKNGFVSQKFIRKLNSYTGGIFMIINGMRCFNRNSFKNL